jgi:hypothetical protein
MAAITTDFGYGGQNLVPYESGGAPTLAGALRDVADDFTGLQIAAIVSADATDLATVQTLANEIKAAINATAVGTYTLLTTKA